MNHLIHADCRIALRQLRSRSVQFVFADPPYPGIDREYGVWVEEDWFDLMDEVVPQIRRVLVPNGSAVFFLKPNSESAGRMRLWVWEFLAKWGREWNVIQDVYAWNFAQLPFGAATTCGLMRGSVANCVWLGESGCYRNQDAVLWSESEVTKARKLSIRANGNRRKNGFTSPSASKRNTDRPRLDAARTYESVDRRGGVTPFNVIMASNTKNYDDDHPARTPEDVVRFWIRYLTKPGDTVLDPFAGSGTTLRVAAEEGRKSIGIEKDAKYVKAIKKRA